LDWDVFIICNYTQRLNCIVPARSLGVAVVAVLGEEGLLVPAHVLGGREAARHRAELLPGHGGLKQNGSSSEYNVVEDASNF
jgi:hypothetical protein